MCMSQGSGHCDGTVAIVKFLALVHPRTSFLLLCTTLSLSIAQPRCRRSRSSTAAAPLRTPRLIPHSSPIPFITIASSHSMLSVSVTHLIPFFFRSTALLCTIPHLLHHRRQFKPHIRNDSLPALRAPGAHGRRARYDGYRFVL